MNDSIVFISDIHFGVPKVPSSYIYNNLKQYFYPKLINSKICFFGGDIFDQILDFDNQAGRWAIAFLDDIFHISDKYNVSLRFLRGTYNHDRMQLDFVREVAKRRQEAQNLNIDLRCFDVIALDYEDKLDLKVLYIPDNLKFNNSTDVILHIKDLMNERNWKYIDIVIAHGYFDYMLPTGVFKHGIVFNTQQFVPFVKKCVLLGHVHTFDFKNHGNLHFYYNGSFERLVHGEEEDKGFITIDISKDKWQYDFIKNKGTIKFCTFTTNYTDVADIDKITNQFDKWFKKQGFDLDRLNYIRLKHNVLEIKQLLGHYIKINYNDYNIRYSSCSTKETKHVDLESEITLDTELELIAPTEANIIDMICDFIRENIDTDNKIDKQEVKDIWELNFNDNNAIDDKEGVDNAIEIYN